MKRVLIPVKRSGSLAAARLPLLFRLGVPGLLAACLLALLSGCGLHQQAATGHAPPPAPPAPASKAAAALPSNRPPNPALAQWRPTSAQFWNGAAKPPDVALTFDAGSDANAVPLILKTLEAHKVHATFFLTGKFCQKFPKECRAIADAGMEIGNHSYSHPHFTKLSYAQIRSQLERAEVEIIKVCGRGAKPLFRFP
jgi:peptidoglycan/xylan/chitin deacetylase (PgdA/CDA1 family)